MIIRGVATERISALKGSPGLRRIGFSRSSRRGLPQPEKPTGDLFMKEKEGSIKNNTTEAWEETVGFSVMTISWIGC